MGINGSMLKSDIEISNGFVAALDEAGRGSLAGPVFAAAVILPKDFNSELIKDSKKLSEKKRQKALKEIEENALAWSVQLVDVEDIDKYNIQNATFGAMNKAIGELSVKPEHILVDGNVFESYDDIPFTCVIKGDNEYLSIAAASIVAKVYRDEYMNLLDEKFPGYGWKKNKGYGSKGHIDVIKEDGMTKYHRKTFLKKILTHA
jgi:ribonuclease HII